VEGTKIYAIVEIAGKQYRVSPGETIDVDCLDKIEGETLEFDRVLLIGDNGATTVGKPVVKGAKIIATSKGTIRGDKVIVYKFKAKVRFRKKTGHHQLYTRLTIDKIEIPEGGRVKEEAVSGT
jgi:large subunit ribosomal protein L21